MAVVRRLGKLANCTGMATSVAGILFLVTMCGSAPVELDPYESLSEKLGRPVSSEYECRVFLQSTFTPGMVYEDVHRQIDEIGANAVVDEIVQSDGIKIEIVELQTGSVALAEYEYLKWDFVFDAEDRLMKVSINSWH
jgi:hypothetical protein